MALRTLRAADRTPVPWKNGGGVTTEVAVYPPGAGFDDFDWRVSLARVDSDGPFSIFPEIDRVLVLLKGTLRLDMDDRAPVELTPASPPLGFAGDVAASARVLAGPALDLNVMVHRGRAEAQVTRLPLAESTAVSLPSPLVLLLATGGALALRLGKIELDLAQFDAAVLEDMMGARIDVEVKSASSAVLISLRVGVSPTA